MSSDDVLPLPAILRYFKTLSLAVTRLRSNARENHALFKPDVSRNGVLREFLALGNAYDIAETWGALEWKRLIDAIAQLNDVFVIDVSSNPRGTFTQHRVIQRAVLTQSNAKIVGRFVLFAHTAERRVFAELTRVHAAHTNVVTIAPLPTLVAIRDIVPWYRYPLETVVQLLCHTGTQPAAIPNDSERRTFGTMISFVKNAINSNLRRLQALRHGS